MTTHSVTLYIKQVVSVYVFGGVAKGFSAKRDVYYMEEDRWGELKWYQYPYHLSKASGFMH